MRARGRIFHTLLCAVSTFGLRGATMPATRTTRSFRRAPGDHKAGRRGHQPVRLPPGPDAIPRTCKACIDSRRQGSGSLARGFLPRDVLIALSRAGLMGSTLITATRVRMVRQHDAVSASRRTWPARGPPTLRPLVSLESDKRRGVRRLGPSRVRSACFKSGG
jgi:hypothetical protein